MPKVKIENVARAAWTATEYGFASLVLVRTLIQTLHRHGVLPAEAVHEIFSQSLRLTEDGDENYPSLAATIRRAWENILDEFPISDA